MAAVRGARGRGGERERGASADAELAAESRRFLGRAYGPPPSWGMLAGASCVRCVPRWPRGATTALDVRHYCVISMRRGEVFSVPSDPSDTSRHLSENGVPLCQAAEVAASCEQECMTGSHLRRRRRASRYGSTVRLLVPGARRGASPASLEFASALVLYGVPRRQKDPRQLGCRP